MSHWVNIKTEVKDLSALAPAVRECGCELITPNAQGDLMFNDRKYYGNHAALIKVPEVPYPIHVDKTATGYKFAVEADYSRQYAARLGRDCSKLIQLYGVHKTLNEARRKGWQAQRVTVGGKINVVITAP
jgi:hypothetical protein